MEKHYAVHIIMILSTPGGVSIDLLKSFRFVYPLQMDVKTTATFSKSFSRTAKFFKTCSIFGHIARKFREKVLLVWPMKSVKKGGGGRNQ